MRTFTMQTISRVAVIAALAAFAVLQRSTTAESGTNTDDVRRFELALGFQPGQTRVIPQLGATIRYLRTQRAASVNGHDVYAVYVEKLD
jgi:hypothetical protein